MSFNWIAIFLLVFNSSTNYSNVIQHDKNANIQSNIQSNVSSSRWLFQKLMRSILKNKWIKRHTRNVFSSRILTHWCKMSCGVAAEFLVNASSEVQNVVEVFSLSSWKMEAVVFLLDILHTFSFTEITVRQEDVFMFWVDSDWFHVLLLWWGLFTASVLLEEILIDEESAEGFFLKISTQFYTNYPELIKEYKTIKN